MKKNFLTTLVLMVVFAMLFSTFAYAAQGPDLTKSCAIVLDYVYDKVPVAGAEFALYRAGEQSEDGLLTLSGDFADYPVTLKGLDNEQFQKAADTLAGYAAADGLVPLAVLKTDGNGHAEKRGLTAGLYLLVAQSYEDEAGSYSAENSLIVLPNNTDGEGWVYEVQVTPKASYLPPVIEPMDLQVVKVWKDAANGGYYRPASVTVHLLCDGEIYDTVVLEEANSWRHEWKGLDHSCSWSVVEEVPPEYTVSITLEGNKFLITNTGKTPPPPTPTPPPIPQTGQLWWPVPVLALLGVTLLAAGLLWRKEDET